MTTYTLAPVFTAAGKTGDRDFINFLFNSLPPTAFEDHDEKESMVAYWAFMGAAEGAHLSLMEELLRPDTPSSPFLPLPKLQPARYYFNNFFQSALAGGNEDCIAFVLESFKPSQAEIEMNRFHIFIRGHEALALPLLTRFKQANQLNGYIFTDVTRHHGLVKAFVEMGGSLPDNDRDLLAALKSSPHEVLAFLAQHFPQTLSYSSFRPIRVSPFQPQLGALGL